MDDKIIMVSHYAPEKIWARFGLLPGEAGRTKFLLIDGQGADGSYEGVIYRSCQEAIGRYTPLRNQVVPGSNHFAPLELAVQLGAPFTWIVEYDVAFGGEWSEFFHIFQENPADFLSACLQNRTENPGWYWWQSHKPLVQGVKEIRSFNPIYRVSLQAAKQLLKRYKEGWVGHHEVTIPTILARDGFNIHDFGKDIYSQKTFTHVPPISREMKKLQHPVKLPQPWMSKAEVEMVESYLTPDMFVVEWGAGGSTCYFAPLVRRWRSIEHDPFWACRTLQSLRDSGVQNAEIVFVPPSSRIRPCFSGPYPQRYEEAFSRYVSAGLEGANPPDAVLVDGRSRLACARAAWQALPSGGLLFFHDFYAPERKRYHLFLSETLPVDSIYQGQTLAVFRK